MGNCKSKRQGSVDCDPDNLQPGLSSVTSQSSAPQCHTGMNENFKTESPINAHKIISMFGHNSRPSNEADVPDGLQHTHETINNSLFNSTRVEVNCLLERINEFQGTSSEDKNYRYLDEMLTRCILKLDQIECNNLEDRQLRREAIRGVNDVIAILERKLAINNEIKEADNHLAE